MAIKIPDVLLQILIPLVVEQGFGAIPEKQKASFCVLFAAGYTELLAESIKTSTTLDNKVVESIGVEVKEYMAEKGFPVLFDDVNDFVVIG